MTPLLECRELCKQNGNQLRALDGVSLGIAPGQFVVVTGPSGSGKTTLLMMLASLDRPTEGTVLFDGQDLMRCSDVGLARIRRQIGFVAQDFALIDGLQAWENVTYPLIPRGTGRRDRLRIAQEQLGRLGLGDRLIARPKELSGGEQQRVAIARALASAPRLLIADEPTSNLDEELGAVVVEVFAELHARGTTVVVATHNMQFFDRADQIVEMIGGRQSSKLPERNTLRNNSPTNCPVTPIDKRRRIGVIGPLALLRLSRWIEQRSQVPGGAEPCHSNSSSNHLLQHPPALSEPGDADRPLGSPASAPAEGPRSLPQRDGAEPPGQQPAEGRS